MVFNFSEGNKQVLEMKKLSDLKVDALQPNVFLLDPHDGFIPYEYSYRPNLDTPTTSPGTIASPLALELADYIQQNNLQSLVAIERLDDCGSTDTWREFQTERYSTFRMRLKLKLKGEEVIGKPTAWIFGRSAGGQIWSEMTCRWRGSC